MASRKIKIDDFEEAINEILDEYKDYVGEASKQAVVKTAEIAKQEIKAASPYRSGMKPNEDGRPHKHYASGWAVREDSYDRFRSDAIIHNRTHYQLAHLLEKGHACRGGGRVEGIPHIAPAEERAAKRLRKLVERIARMEA